jgi:hypothetical protein
MSFFKERVEIGLEEAELNTQIVLSTLPPFFQMVFYYFGSGYYSYLFRHQKHLTKNLGQKIRGRSGNGQTQFYRP